MAQAPAPTARRSLGLKLLLVCGLALLMTIPAMFVFVLLYDRTSHAEQTVEEISKLVGGPQQFAGPVLSIPYTVPAPPPANGERAQSDTTGAYIIFPKTAAGSATVAIGEKHRGLFKAATWTSNLSLRSDFDLAEAGKQLPANARPDWSRAELLVGASDARGAQADITLTGPGLSARMTPAMTLSSTGVEAPDAPPGPRRVYAPGHDSLKFFGTPAAAIAKPGAVFSVTANLKFGGARRMAMLAYGETTTFHAAGGWGDPSYDGGFLPTTHRETGKSGTRGAFTADWSVPYIARGVAGEGTSDILTSLGATSLGVTFIDSANPYQAVSRSLKYAVMFIGLVFLAYFVFETALKRRVHPAQYVLIGLAQVIFYLLLLSISERVGFDFGFLIAAGATVSLISAYAGWVFDSRRQGTIAFGAFSVLYGLIYVLMRLDDWALLVGAVTSFAAIAGVMYATRKVDWYGDGPSETPAR